MFSAAGGVLGGDSGYFDSRSLVAVDEEESKRQKSVMVDFAAFSGSWNGKDVWRPDADRTGGRDNGSDGRTAA